MPSSSYILNNTKYTSKASVIKRAREQMNAFRGKTLDCDHPEFKFFVDLFSFHNDAAEKVGVGVHKIHFRPCHVNPAQTTTYIERVDGSEIIISCSKCLAPPEKPKATLTVVMRRTIRPDISRFRHEQPELKCQLCEDNGFGPMHVDHIYPFSKIRDEFLAQTTIRLPTEYDKDYQDLRIFKEKDAEFEKEWIVFHNEHAKYQMLCQTCNLLKGSTFEAIESNRIPSNSPNYAKLWAGV